MSSDKKFSKFRLWCTKPSGQPNQHLEVQPIVNLPEEDYCLEQSAPILEESFPIKETVSFQNLEQSQTNFLSLFGLVTSETSEVLLKKSQERKKRSCSSPYFLTLLLQAEKQDLDGNDLPEVKPKKRKGCGGGEVMKKREKSTSSPTSGMDNNLKVITIQTCEEEGDINDYHEEICCVCSNVGELLLCDTCPQVYHLHCAQLQQIPQGKWFCQLCQDKLPENFKAPAVTEENVKWRYAALQRQRKALLKEAFTVRYEKADMVFRTKEVITVLENKENIERRYIEKIDDAKQLKANIDLFLASL